MGLTLQLRSKCYFQVLICMKARHGGYEGWVGCMHVMGHILGSSSDGRQGNGGGETSAIRDEWKDVFYMISCSTSHSSMPTRVLLMSDREQIRRYSMDCVRLDKARV